jgi:hypothetical protein
MLPANSRRTQGFAILPCRRHHHRDHYRLNLFILWFLPGRVAITKNLIFFLAHVYVGILYKGIRAQKKSDCPNKVMATLISLLIIRGGFKRAFASHHLVQFAHNSRVAGKSYRKRLVLPT